jgi:uncharacterized protein YndB with AHSA1/START domain
MPNVSPLDGGGSFEPGPGRVKRAASVTARAEIVLPAGVEDVWRRLLDWEGQARWMRDADRVDVLTPHRAGAGVVIAVRTRVLNIPLFTERLEVVAWEPPRRLRLVHGTFVRGYGEWRLAAVARGGERGTRLSWEERLWLGIPLLGSAALAVYHPFMEHLMRGSLENLRRIVAAGHAGNDEPGEPSFNRIRLPGRS